MSRAFIVLVGAVIALFLFDVASTAVRWKRASESKSDSAAWERFVSQDCAEIRERWSDLPGWRLTGAQRVLLQRCK